MKRVETFLLFAAMGCRAPAPAHPASAPQPTIVERLPESGAANCAETVRNRERSKIKSIGPTRACVTDTVDLDYASLPVLGPAHDSPVGEGVVESVNNYIPRMGRGNRPMVLPLEWVLFDRTKLEPDELFLFHGEGWGSEVEKTFGHAAAVVRGMFYAFRICKVGCQRGLDATTREETLVLVGPGAEWVASSTDAVNSPLDYPMPYDWHPDFAFASAAIKPGSSATVGWITSGDTRERFRKLFGSEPPADADPDPKRLENVSLEVVWPVGTAPALSLYRSTLLTSADTQDR